MKLLNQLDFTKVSGAKIFTADIWRFEESEAECIQNICSMVMKHCIFAQEQFGEPHLPQAAGRCTKS